MFRCFILFLMSSVLTNVMCSHAMAEDTFSIQILDISEKDLPSGSSILCSSGESDTFESAVIRVGTRTKGIKKPDIKTEFGAEGELSSTELQPIAEAFLAKGITQPLKCLRLSVDEFQVRYPEFFIQELLQKNQNNVGRARRSLDDAVYVNLLDPAHNSVSRKQLQTFFLAGAITYSTLGIVGYSNLAAIPTTLVISILAGLCLPPEYMDRFASGFAGKLYAVVNYIETKYSLFLRDAASEEKSHDE